MKIPGIGPRIVENILAGDGLRAAEKEIRWLEANGSEAIFYLDPRFPDRLKSRDDAPILLFFRGSEADLLNWPRTVAVVGTRKPTDYGRSICERIIDGLGRHNSLIISGLAYGIDVTAHRFCTQKSLPTIGVLGSGLGRIYPDAHRSVAEKMFENGGILSEFGHAVGPDREHFPQRNRIVAGMADALLVVETTISGGSMITVQKAVEWGRPVFAVPARAGETVGEGCNLLIKTGRAALCETADDLAHAMGWDAKKSKGRQISIALDLPENEQIVLEKVRKSPEIAIDDLVFELQKSPGELAAAILSLEFKGLLRTLPGKRYLAS